MSLPPREAWIEIGGVDIDAYTIKSRFPRGKRGLKLIVHYLPPSDCEVASPAGSVD